MVPAAAPRVHDYSRTRGNLAWQPSELTSLRRRRVHRSALPNEPRPGIAVDRSMPIVAKSAVIVPPPHPSRQIGALPAKLFSHTIAINLARVGPEGADRLGRTLGDLLASQTATDVPT